MQLDKTETSIELPESDSATAQKEYSNSDSDEYEPDDREPKEDYISSDSSLSESDESTENLQERLASWAVRNKCTRVTVNEILTILRGVGLNLPQDSRTLLRTPKTVNVTTKCGGEYIYLGIEQGILNVLSRNQHFHQTCDSIHLNVNVDGLPIFKSSTLWPILCSFEHFSPFIVCLFLGKTKPTPVQDFLSDFIHEFCRLKDSGITISSKIRKTVRATR